MDSCIVLRTAILKDGMMYVQAGGGVVADSVPEREYQETVDKAKAVFRAAEEAVRYAGASNSPVSATPFETAADAASSR
jgi:anthranilate synthase component 1